MNLIYLLGNKIRVTIYVFYLLSLFYVIEPIWIRITNQRE